MKRISKFILVVLVCIIALITFISSWFIWNNNKKNRIGVTFTPDNLSLSCVNYNITYNDNKKLIPTSSMNGGYLTNINVNSNCNNDVYLELNLKINKLSTTLKDKSFKYTLTSNDTIISEGDFQDKRENETINIALNQLITNNKNYKLYLWIDSNINNKIEPNKQIYDFTVTANATDKPNMK